MNVKKWAVSWWGGFTLLVSPCDSRIYTHTVDIVSVNMLHKVFGDNIYTHTLTCSLYYGVKTFTYLSYQTKII